MKELSAAMALAFAKIEGAIKGKTNPAFRSKYADLSSVVDAVKPALAEHGLWFRQITHPADGGVCVETVIHHSSGESLACGPLFVPASKQDAQGFGSALTYCRRYSLMAAFGVPAEDDDGNAAVQSKPAQKPPVAINDTEGTMVLDSLREAAMGGLDALQERFKKIPNTPTKSAVWAKHQGELKAVAAAQHMPEVPAFPSTKVAA
jgi:hypothetical protein